MPGQRLLRRAKRKILPYDASLDDWTLEQGVRMIEMLRLSKARLEDSVVLELGSGWKPSIPLLLRAAGVRQVILTDSQRLLDARLLAETARRLAARADEYAPRVGVSPALFRERLLVAPARRKKVDETAGRLGLRYLAPIDARRLPLESGAVDIVVSRAVLEHIPPPIIAGLFEEFRRVLRTDGCVCHVIDNSDHWSHLDGRLSKLNFLRYSDGAWRWFALNPLDFMNRLRHSDYLKLLSDAGFDVTLDSSEPDADALMQLKSLRLDSKFRAYPEEDLAILTSYIVASPRQGARLH